MSPNLRGALFMAASMAAFVANDAFLKSLSGDMSLFQAVFLRGVVGSLLLIALAAWLGKLSLRIPARDFRMILLRTLAEIAAAYLFISALFNMPIANASAIMQALPLTVTLAGAVFLGESVGWRRMSAILVGFLGVILIVRPGVEGFTVYSLYAVGAVVCVTVRDLAARAVSSATSSMSVAIAASIGVGLFGGLGLLTVEWQPVTVSGAAAVVGASVMIMGAYLFSILTMRVGSIAFIAPFRYTSLLWSLLLGLVFFGEWPDGLTLAGAGIVVATGIFAFDRERKLARAASIASGAGASRQA